jgi:hypothetical protein
MIKLRLRQHILESVGAKFYNASLKRQKSKTHCVKLLIMINKQAMRQLKVGAN